MKQINFELVEDGDKYYELVPLYNAWHNKTWMLSTGNTQVSEWFELLDYCKQNKKETAHFYLELIDVHEQEMKEGIRSDNFVGFFNDIIYECFKDDDKFPLLKTNLYLCGSIIQKYYIEFINSYLNNG